MTRHRAARREITPAGFVPGRGGLGGLPPRWRGQAAGWAAPVATPYRPHEFGVEAAWRIVEPVLHAAAVVHRYPRGSWGPPETAGLIEPDGGWLDPRPNAP